MLACLQIRRHTPKSIIEKALGRLTKPKTLVCEKSAFGAGYFLITAQIKGNRAVDWHAVKNHIPPSVRVLLTPGSHPPPEELGFPPPYFPDFEQQVLLRTACALIQIADIPIYRRVLGLLDKTGEHSWMLPQLLCHYSCVRVLTENTGHYEIVAEDIMEQMGAPVQFSSSPGDFSDCALVLSPKDGADVLSKIPACPVLAGRPFSGAGKGTTFSGLRVLPESEAPAQIPPGICPHEFAGALWELYGISLGDERAKHILINGRRARLEEATALILKAGPQH